MILGATRIETLREVLAGRAHASTMAGLASVPQFQAGRAQFPEISAPRLFRLSESRLAGSEGSLDAGCEKERNGQNVSTSKEAVPSAAPDWLGQMNLQVVSRHLHYSSSVSWKDAKGIHWDQWVE